MGQVELARWMGPELIRPCLYDKLRDAQKEELDKLIADAPPGRPQVRRHGGASAMEVAGGSLGVCQVNLCLWRWQRGFRQTLILMLLRTLALLMQPERLTRKEAVKQAAKQAAAAAAGDAGEAAMDGAAAGGGAVAAAAEEQVGRHPTWKGAGWACWSCR